MSDILIFGAHPDDVELCCGGSVKKLADAGHKITIADLTRGEMGTRGTPELRAKEAQEAKKILGVDKRVNLELPDGGLTNHLEHQRQVIRVIRKFTPHICIITAPEDRHPDHTHATELLIDSIYFSGLKKIVTTDESGQTQSPWRPPHTLHYMQDRPFEPNMILDISETMDAKLNAILAYSSQFNVPAEQGDETYISSSQFFEGIKARARHYGHLIGVEYGEPFKYHGGPIPLNSFKLFEETAPKR